MKLGRKCPRSDSPSQSKQARPKSRLPPPPPPLHLHICERARAIAREIIKDHISHVNDIQDRETIRALNQFEDNPTEIEDDDPEVASDLIFEEQSLDLDASIGRHDLEHDDDEDDDGSGGIQIDVVGL